ncbi:MAG: SRPBCC family protein [Solirubrobacterales bacterium]|nr:SRPBCC family protein [Solirubrobacterales bacterium]
MRAVTVAVVLPGTVRDAERCWYNTARWPVWVDGLDRVVDVSEGWPEPGSTVSWESVPAGRGSVAERVVAREPLGGQTVEVRDDSIQGRQTVAFAPVVDGVEVRLTLEYEIIKRSLLTPLIDVLFVKRPMTTSLSTTLSRFAAELFTRGAQTSP